MKVKASHTLTWGRYIMFQELQHRLGFPTSQRLPEAGEIIFFQNLSDPFASQAKAARPPGFHQRQHDSTPFLGYTNCWLDTRHDCHRRAFR